MKKNLGNVGFLTSGIYLYTNKRESFLTSLPNSSRESAPIGTYDIPYDSAYHVEQTGGMRFPEFSAPWNKTQATTG